MRWLMRLLGWDNRDDSSRAGLSDEDHERDKQEQEEAKRRRQELLIRAANLGIEADVRIRR